MPTSRKLQPSESVALLIRARFQLEPRLHTELPRVFINRGRCQQLESKAVCHLHQAVLKSLLHQHIQIQVLRRTMLQSLPRMTSILFCAGMCSREGRCRVTPASDGSHHHGAGETCPEVATLLRPHECRERTGGAVGRRCVKDASANHREMWAGQGLGP